MNLTTALLRLLIFPGLLFAIPTACSSFGQNAKQ